MSGLARQEDVLLVTTLVGLGLLVLGILELVWPTRPRRAEVGPFGGRLAGRAEPEPPSGRELWLNRGRLVRVSGWSAVWVLFFWAFLLMGFPTETAKGWLADRLEQGVDARFSFEELHIRWNLGVRLKGIAIKSPPPESRLVPAGQGSAEWFAIRLESFTVEPRLSSLILGKSAINFSGDTASGGHLVGSYIAGDISFSFKDISFKDITIATLPFPSSATMSGAGGLKVVTRNGTIDTEIDGIPGGRQKLKMPGGTGPAVDGKLKIAVSLPRL